MIFGCARANVFHFIGAPHVQKGLPPRLQRTLDNGTKVHELIQDSYLTENFEWWFSKEVPVRLAFGDGVVQGRSDGTLIHRISREGWTIEIKTMEETSFKTLTKPKVEHILQAAVYCEAQKLNGIIVLYWDKNRSYLKEFVVWRTDPLVRKALDLVGRKVEALHKSGSAFDETRDKRKLPIYDKSVCNKSFCGYVEYCRRYGAPV